MTKIPTQPEPTQPFPKTGSLADNMNLDLKTLRTGLQRETGLVYGYVVASIECPCGTFVQTGCGPNFQGGLITLCTCKHFMRSALELADWPGKWIAGFTGVNRVRGQRLNYLFYVMRVAHAYPSHRDLWYKLSETERQAKAARLNPLGDLYQPHQPGGDPFDPGTYEPPCSDHSHFPNEWHKDIDYKGYGGRRPLLLVGDRHFSFLWDRPMIAYPSPMHRGTKKHHNLSNLLDSLK